MFLFHPEAEAEFNMAIDYYEGCAAGLGTDFTIEVYSTIEQIIAHPKAWIVLEDEVRRNLTRRFPYGILYAIDSEQIFILAVMNLHRDPDYWKHRSNDKTPAITEF